MIDLSKNDEKREQFFEAIFGQEEDVDDELASAILALNEIDEAQLVADLKTTLQEHLRQLSQDESEAKHLRTAIRSITEFEKKNDPNRVEPKSYIWDLFSNVATAFQRPVFSFHNRQDGEMPEEDKKILDKLKKELEEDSE